MLKHKVCRSEPGQNPGLAQQRRRRQPHQSGDGEVSGVHLLGQPVHFPPGVDEDDGLSDGQGLVQVTQRVQLPLL